MVRNDSFGNPSCVFCIVLDFVVLGGCFISVMPSSRLHKGYGCTQLDSWGFRIPSIVGGILNG